MIAKFSLIILIISTIPALLLFANLAKKAHTFDTAIFQPVQAHDQKWIAVNSDRSNDKLTNINHCYYESSSEALIQKLKDFNNWRDSTQSLYTSHLYLFLLLFLILKIYGGFLEAIFYKKSDNRMKNLAIRLIIILLSDLIIFKFLFFYRLLIFIELDSCLGTMESSEFTLDLISNKMGSKSTHWIHSFLNLGIWDYQIKFCVICTLISLILILRFRRLEQRYSLLIFSGGWFLLVLGLFGTAFDITLVKYEKGIYDTLISQINFIMFFRMLVAIIDNIVQFLFSPNFEKNLNIPEGLRFNFKNERLDSQGITRGVVRPAYYL